MTNRKYSISLLFVGIKKDGSGARQGSPIDDDSRLAQLQISDRLSSKPPANVQYSNIATGLPRGSIHASHNYNPQSTSLTSTTKKKPAKGPMLSGKLSHGKAKADAGTHVTS